MSSGKIPLVTLLGPTASGKTHLAVRLAAALNAEIISGDSRQVFRGMDLGTGKDLEEYVCEGRLVPYHLIDIADAGYKYSVFEYQRDFLEAWKQITARRKPVVLCGGTGLYIESVLRSYRLEAVPANPELRAALEGQSLDELTRRLASYKNLHNTTDVDTARRAVRAIEIEEYYATHPAPENAFPEIPSLVFGLDLDRDVRRARITERLKTRLSQGMIDEVKGLLDRGVSPDALIGYGLEYKYLTLYIQQKLTYNELFVQLETAIHQFAKRQMTWFRGMEKRGTTIHWLEATAPVSENVEKMLELIHRAGPVCD